MAKALEPYVGRVQNKHPSPAALQLQNIICITFKSLKINSLTTMINKKTIGTYLIFVQWGINRTKWLDYKWISY